MKSSRSTMTAMLPASFAVSGLLFLCEGLPASRSPELTVDDSPSPVTEFVRKRAGESLAHVFTLLSLVPPREPSQIAFRGLEIENAHLQGTAPEYLEGVLPATIRQGLWPSLEHRPVSRSVRSRDEITSDLLRSHHSIMLNLQELRQRAALATVNSGV